MYPNPTQDWLYIDGQFKSAEIYGMNGRLLQTTTETSIDVSILPKGMYFIQFHTNAATAIVQRFVKQ
jgi:hypothetical protein